MSEALSMAAESIWTLRDIVLTRVLISWPSRYLLEMIHVSAELDPVCELFVKCVALTIHADSGCNVVT